MMQRSLNLNGRYRESLYQMLDDEYSDDLTSDCPLLKFLRKSHSRSGILL